jgi:hypothetical protein
LCKLHALTMVRSGAPCLQECGLAYSGAAVLLASLAISAKQCDTPDLLHLMGVPTTNQYHFALQQKLRPAWATSTTVHTGPIAEYNSNNLCLTACTLLLCRYLQDNTTWTGASRVLLAAPADGSYLIEVSHNHDSVDASATPHRAWAEAVLRAVSDKCPHACNGGNMVTDTLQPCS